MSVWWQYLVPQHGISRLVLAATRVQVRWFKDALISGFLRLFAIDMSDAEQPDPHAYPSFNAFFTRALRAGSRPLAAAAADIASPVDGTVSECGRIEHDSLLQAKGRSYTLAELLAGQPWAGSFIDGSFATIYLAPYNYHRIHLPLDGRLLDTVYVPGRLFSVNRTTAARVPRLFARNERVLTLWDSAAGPFALVLVGALNVGSMATVWAGEISPRRPRIVTRLAPVELALAKGAELGRFNMGSTVILLFGPGRARWAEGLASGRVLRCGERLGDIR